MDMNATEMNENTVSEVMDDIYIYYMTDSTRGRELEIQWQTSTRALDARVRRAIFGRRRRRRTR